MLPQSTQIDLVKSLEKSESERKATLYVFSVLLGACLGLVLHFSYLAGIFYSMRCLINV